MRIIIWKCNIWKCNKYRHISSGTSIGGKTLGMRVRRGIGPRVVVAEAVKYTRMGRWFRLNDNSTVFDPIEESQVNATNVSQDGKAQEAVNQQARRAEDMENDHHGRQPQAAQNNQRGNFVNVRSLVKLLPDIKAKLKKNTNRYNLFKSTVFGPWLDVPNKPGNDNHLMNYVLQHQVYVPDVTDECSPITFHIGDNRLHFGRKEFCLVTGLRFGKLAVVDDKEITYVPFCERVFPDKCLPGPTQYNVKGQHFVNIVLEDKFEKTWLALSDEDAVRICLVVVSVVILSGREGRFNIPKHIMLLVEDFAAFNAFPWGEYLWKIFYLRTVNVVPKHANHHTTNKKKNPEFVPTYNLYGFVWAFKIWILESFPKSRIWWNKDDDVILRGLAWSSKRKFEKTDYNTLFGPMSDPIIDLAPTDKELKAPWYIISVDYFNSLAGSPSGAFRRGIKWTALVSKSARWKLRPTIVKGNHVNENVDHDDVDVNDEHVEEKVQQAASVNANVESEIPKEPAVESVNEVVVDEVAPNADIGKLLADFDALKQKIKCIENRVDGAQNMDVVNEIIEVTKRMFDMEIALKLKSQVNPENPKTAASTCVGSNSEIVDGSIKAGHYEPGTSICEADNVQVVGGSSKAINFEASTSIGQSVNVEVLHGSINTVEASDPKVGTGSPKVIDMAQHIASTFKSANGNDELEGGSSKLNNFEASTSIDQTVNGEVQQGSIKMVEAADHVVGTGSSKDIDMDQVACSSLNGIDVDDSQKSSLNVLLEAFEQTQRDPGMEFIVACNEDAPHVKNTGVPISVVADDYLCYTLPTFCSLWIMLMNSITSWNLVQKTTTTQNIRWTQYLKILIRKKRVGSTKILNLKRRMRVFIKKQLCIMKLLSFKRSMLRLKSKFLMLQRKMLRLRRRMDKLIMTSHKNVATCNEKPRLEIALSSFKAKKPSVRKTYAGKPFKSPYPRKPKTRSMTAAEQVSLKFTVSPIPVQNTSKHVTPRGQVFSDGVFNLPPFVEDLSRPEGCKKDMVTVPVYMQVFVRNGKTPLYRFPWGYRDIPIGRDFWLALLCKDVAGQGWLSDNAR
ncbi:phospholipase-like protein [Artemisia annua]|uniref:Phospholipase-like protein n=1 Tax=Artemisia annua TaxID=35608 RepID=A0A2U1PG75_ARTAN|nr:phospholipase-like protein [Artemisia annua]